MGEILESDWTLGAIRRREDERLERLRAASPGDEARIGSPLGRDISGNNWVAEAFRRRQEEERAKAARHQSNGGERAPAANKEVPVDNWLIEGFKRHQDEERRRERFAAAEVVAAVSEDRSTADGDMSPSDRDLAEERLALAEDAEYTREPEATNADDGVSAESRGSLPILHGAIPANKPPQRAARIVVVAGLVVVGGVLAIVGLTTALRRPVRPPERVGGTAPLRAPPSINKQEGAPGQGAPLRAPDAATTSAPPVKAPDNPPQSSPAPRAEQEHGAGAPPAGKDNGLQETDTAPAAPPNAPRAGQEPSAGAPPSGKNHGPQETQATPAAPPSAPAPRDATETAPPARPDKSFNAEPTPPVSGGAREPIRSEPENNVSETKPPAANTNVDTKLKPKSKARSSSRRSPQKADGFSAFLKRTAKSVRKFFGRLGE